MEEGRGEEGGGQEVYCVFAKLGTFLPLKLILGGEEGGDVDMRYEKEGKEGNNVMLLAILGEVPAHRHCR